MLHAATAAWPDTLQVLSTPCSFFSRFPPRAACSSSILFLLAAAASCRSVSVGVLVAEVSFVGVPTCDDPVFPLHGGVSRCCRLRREVLARLLLSLNPTAAITLSLTDVPGSLLLTAGWRGQSAVAAGLFTHAHTTSAEAKSPRQAPTESRGSVSVGIYICIYIMYT